MIYQDWMTIYDDFRIQSLFLMPHIPHFSAPHLTTEESRRPAAEWRGHLRRRWCAVHHPGRHPGHETDAPWDSFPGPSDRWDWLVSVFVGVVKIVGVRSFPYFLLIFFGWKRQSREFRPFLNNSLDVIGCHWILSFFFSKVLCFFPRLRHLEALFQCFWTALSGWARIPASPASTEWLRWSPRGCLSTGLLGWELG